MTTPVSTPGAFIGPDADFDFGGRSQIQKIEGPPSPTEEEERKQREKEEQTQNGVGMSSTRRRLRKLSLGKR